MTKEDDKLKSDFRATKNISFTKTMAILFVLGVYIVIFLKIIFLK